MPQKAQDPDEIFDVVDENDRVVATDTRANVHAKKLFHRAVHIFVFRDNGDILVQQRSFEKDTCPGLFSTSCAGHVDSGESYEAAAARELREELGIALPATDLVPLFSQRPSAENGNEFVRGYAVKNFTGEITPNPAEIIRMVAFSPQQLQEEIEKNPEKFAPSFIFAWQDFLATEAKNSHHQPAEESPTNPNLTTKPNLTPNPNLTTKPRHH